MGIVVDRDSASFTATSQFRVIGPTGDVLAVVDGGRVWHVTPADGGRLTLVRPDRVEPVLLPGPVAVRPESESDLVVINGRRYRGEGLLLRGTVGVTVVNVVPIEAYLRGVVPLELGFRSAPDREAVLAQAVAARTFVVRNRGRREALGFDVFPTDADQVYHGVEGERTETDEAVRRTWGEVLTWQGRPIQALFHSTCGWSTEAASQVFQSGESAPYLRAVSDRSGSGRNAFYCSISPRFRWREEWDEPMLRSVLSVTLPSALGGEGVRITDLRVARTTPTGRVAELLIQTTAGSVAVPHYRIREVLRPAADRQLLSTMFQLHVQKRNGELERVVAAGAGYGHGVGMCQFGAVGRARAGWDHRRILAAYYPDTRLERIY